MSRDTQIPLAVIAVKQIRYARKGLGKFRVYRCPGCGNPVRRGGAICTACGLKLPLFYSRLRAASVAVLLLAAVVSVFMACNVQPALLSQRLSSWYREHVGRRVTAALRLPATRPSNTTPSRLRMPARLRTS